ncbi:MAG: succinyl-diaminopimelate desuccinylase [Succinivibrio sp.]|nr:succinyl-diaminopimelate desuccinylase [Succinivibrio sp.]
MHCTPTEELACKLVKIPSVTPADLGCQDLLAAPLQACGFKIIKLPCQDVNNLLALHGEGTPFTLFLGHTDVVPPGERASWRHEPFLGECVEYDGQPVLYGRGSADMKTGDAAMTMALCDFVTARPDHPGTVGLLITSNEEGDARGGTPYALEYLKAQQLIPDYCMIAECSCERVFGDEIKNGRRGDCNATLVIAGKQGHVALPEHCLNAAHEAARFITAMLAHPLDLGDRYFPPSSFQISNMHCGTGADNVVPGSCTLRCNFRYNNQQNYESLQAHTQAVLEAEGIRAELDWQPEGLPFFTPEGAFTRAVQHSVAQVLGITPTFSARGGTSDGRFVAQLGTQVIEFGPVSSTIHQADERVSWEVIEQLKQIYELSLHRLCALPPKI